jgi:hypothetical protein
MGTRYLPSRSRKPFALPGMAGSVMPRKMSGMRVSNPASPSADKIAMVCIKVSAVPPDLEIATKRLVACGSLASSFAKVSASRLSMKRNRGGTPSAPMPATAYPASCAKVCPPRLEPPVPRMTMSVARSASWRAVSRMFSRSLRASGKRSSGRLRSAWRARSQSSAPSARISAASSSRALMPCDPMCSSRALSIDWAMFILVFA